MARAEVNGQSMMLLVSFSKDRWWLLEAEEEEEEERWSDEMIYKDNLKVRQDLYTKKER